MKTNSALSYHPVVEMIKPAVVGISFPGAKPFLQNNTPFNSYDLQQVNQANPSTSRQEYLECQNCGVKLELQPGIPKNATCPNCKMVMAYIIREDSASAAQRQAWGSTLTANCPACGILVARDPKIPWRSLSCPNCGSRLPCPATGGMAQQQALEDTQNQEDALLQGQANTVGSGVIVSRKGYVLTNYHLIQRHRQATVTLFTGTGTKSYMGIVVAEAPQIDLAVLKIDSKDVISFPAAPIGDSQMLDVGDAVLAFGNPYGLSQTVTNGIVSAVRKNIIIGGQQLTNIIQTDAPINQGNSGGPLVNSQGEVIGINTAIFSPAETSTGLGFAIPINQARETLGEFMDPTGSAPAQQQSSKHLNTKANVYKVAQTEDAPAWVGLDFQILNDALRAELKVPFDSGILINKVFPNSPAEAAGLQRGDVIYSLNGRRVTDETKLRTFLADKKPGDVIKMLIFRDGKRVKISLPLAGGAFQGAKMTEVQKAAFAGVKTDLLKGSEIEAGSADLTSLGLTVDNITPEVAFAFGIPEGTKGALISEVEGLALAAGIKGGDVIVETDGEPVYDLVTFFKILRSKSDLTNGVELGLMRNGGTISITIRDTDPNVNQGI